MKKFIISYVALLIVCSCNDVKAQNRSTGKSQQFMQVMTLESLLPGGLGRSKMIITNPDGTQKESDMENLFSMIGINFKNIKQNEDKLVKTLKDYSDNGWKIEHVTSLTLSQNDSGSGGIFMTRYLLSKQDSN